MSDPFTSLQPDSGHMLEKIITKIGTIITKKIRFQFLGNPLLWQVVNQMVSEVSIFSQKWRKGQSVCTCIWDKPG